MEASPPDPAPRSPQRAADKEPEKEPEKKAATEDIVMDSSEEEEEEDAPNEYQKDGFVVANDEGEEKEAKARKLTKRAKNPEDVALDEDDLALIEENTGVKLARPKTADAKRRLKKYKADDAEKQLEKELFGDVVADEAEAAGEEEASESPEKAKADEDIAAEERARADAEEDAEQVRQVEEEEEEEEGLDDFIEYEPGQERATKRSATSTAGAGSISSRALKEANAIFGDFTDFMPNVAATKRTKEDKDTLADVEPALLAERFRTPQDARLRSTTLPERYEMLVIDLNRAPPEDGELHEEAVWIFERAFAPVLSKEQNVPIAKEVKDHLVPKIETVLGFMRSDNLEVPFIARYRQDYWAEGLQAVHLWDIAEWDERWLHLHKRKRQVETMFKQTQEGSIHPEEALSVLRTVSTEEELTDMHDYYNLHVSSNNNNSASAPAAAAAVGGPSHKRPVKRDLYSVCRRAGLLNAATYFGLSADKFGENLFANVMTTSVSDHSESPHELAERFTCAGFTEAEAVLRACRFIKAEEIAYEPRVRQWLRPRYALAALLSTVATPRGKKEIDAWHQHRAIKRLLNKPILALKNTTQLLQVLQAESLGLLTKRITVNSAEDELFVREMERLYLSDQFGKHSAAWNEQRRLIIREALSSHLYPLLEKELVQTLTADAKRLVAQQCGRKLEDMLMQGRYRGASPASVDPHEAVSVVACVWGGSQPSWFVALDKDGGMVDTLKLPFIGIRADPERNRPDYERKQDDLARLRAFISQHEPHALMLGAAPGADGGVDSRRLWDELTNVANELRAGSSIFRDLQVLWIDGEPAHVYKNSSVAAQEFAEEPPVVRQAIALGRYAQDPLSLLAALYNPAQDILGLKLHPLQDMLSKDERLRQLERRFIKVVNIVGVDLRRITMHRHASATLQFVAGLGPRKAAYLLQQLTKGRVRSRDKLQELVSPTVYTNCAGFLAIRSASSDDDDDAAEPLDATRVHPADYPFARKMAADAIDSADVDDPGLVLDIMRAPERLESLAGDALEQAAQEWEKRQKEKKLKVLYDIKEELTAPFRDPRPVFRSLSEEQLFWLLTGETPDTLRVGQLLTVQVQAIRADRVVCVLDSGITGFIAKANVSDQALNRIDEKVTRDMILPTRLLSIDKAAFTAELTARGSELAARDRWEQAHLGALWERERYLMPDSPEREEKREEVKAKAAPVQMRNVTHPYFKNVSAKDADEMLKEKPDGEFVIRPATTSPDHLTLCWKWNGLIMHFDVHELNKPKRFELGKKLRLGQETFDDLNELIARYVEPMTQLAREVSEFRYFRRGSIEEVEREMREVKAAQSARIPYFISPSQHSGRYVLSYLPSTRPKHELFTLTPRGLRFRGQLFPDTEHLIKHLKVTFGRATTRR